MSTLLRRSRKSPDKGRPAARRDIPPGMRPPPLEPLRNPGLPPARLLEVHRFLRLNRMLEDKLSGLYRQGKIVGGLYSSLGQESISVGTACALAPGDLLAPMIRNIGSLLVRGVPPLSLFLQFLARHAGPTGGKDGTLHFDDPGRSIVGPISVLGTLIPVMTGAALAARMRGEERVALTYIGDGGTSTGDFHEGLNLAAVLGLPLVLVVEHNGYAYSTPVDRQFAVDSLAERGPAYGIASESIDGTDVLAVYGGPRTEADGARARRSWSAGPSAAGGTRSTMTWGTCPGRSWPPGNHGTRSTVSRPFSSKGATRPGTSCDRSRRPSRRSSTRPRGRRSAARTRRLGRRCGACTPGAIEGADAGEAAEQTGARSGRPARRPGPGGRGRAGPGRRRAPQDAVLHEADARPGVPHRAQALPSGQDRRRRLRGARPGGDLGGSRHARPAGRRRGGGRHCLPVAPRHGRVPHAGCVPRQDPGPVHGTRRRPDARPGRQHAHGRSAAPARR